MADDMCGSACRSVEVDGTARVDKGLKKQLERILSGLIRVRCSVTADTVVH